jgi:hypothetical protein
VPFARDLHPEFGYLGSAPRVFRRLRLILSFLALGIVAGASGVAVFMASPASDLGTSGSPLDAMALAPTESLIEPKLALPEPRPANDSVPEKAAKEGANSSPSKGVSTKPTCREGLSDAREGDCVRVEVVRVRPLRAVNERPLIAAVPIGHRDDPATLPLPPSAPVEASPSPAAPPEQPSTIAAATETAVAEATPADAALTVEPTLPAVAAKKPRPQVHHARNESGRHARNESRSSRRNNYSYASSYSSRSSVSLQGGYARLW